MLVLGSGGREHALAWRLARDPEPAEVRVAPGNDGMGRAFARVDLSEADADRIADRCRADGVELVVVGPEAPLTAGIVDTLAARGIPVFGPTREAARLESSKWFAKEVMREAGVPTARAEAFEDLGAARAALERFRPPYVVKADGLAAGKGVRVAAGREGAEAFLAECLDGGRFGAAGHRVLIEEHLEGEEASVIAVCDGVRHVLLPPARDYKRAYDGDHGPNTGGMGAFAPVSAVGPGLERAIGERIVTPVLAAMARRGMPFRGALYCGLMLCGDEARVIEFNVRFGDPEAQVVLPLLEGSLRRLLASAAAGRLDPDAVRRAPGAAVAVALADEGYPDAVRGGGVITGLDPVEQLERVVVFHAAGTAGPAGQWRAAGGRIAYVVGLADTVAAARTRAYDAIARLGGSGWRC
ncbi:MAG TPA: phosphoribosylamine--glycine ligase, partial [Candidatus Eisenbacteria bacterium]